MEPFEFVFVLYSLLLGLSMVELLGGLGRALEIKLTEKNGDTPIKIGWLTPMLAVFVMLDLLSFWAAAWVIRDQVSVSIHGLLAVVVFASAYFLAARLVFPSERSRMLDLDAHYFAVRRPVLALLLTLLSLQLIFYWTLPALRPTLANPLSLGMTLVLIALMVATMAVRSYKASLTLLAALIARYLIVYML